MEHLFYEQISQPGIRCAVGVGAKWLVHFIVDCFNVASNHLYVHMPSSPTEILMRRLEAEAADMDSFIEKKTNQERKIEVSNTLFKHVGGDLVAQNPMADDFGIVARMHPLRYRSSVAAMPVRIPPPDQKGWQVPQDAIAHHPQYTDEILS